MKKCQKTAGRGGGGDFFDSHCISTDDFLQLRFDIQTESEYNCFTHQYKNLLPKSTVPGDAR